MTVYKVEHNAVYWISVILTALFCWIVFPIKWIKKWQHKRNKARCMSNARKKSNDTNAIVYVVQWGKSYFYGTRTELRQQVDRRGKKAVKYATKHHCFDVDFRNAIVARFKNGILMENECCR